MKKVKYILFVVFAFLMFLTSCQKEEYIIVKSNSMVGNSSYSELYDIKSFKKDDSVAIEEINSKNFHQLKIGDVVGFYDTEIRNINFHRIVYISFDENGSIHSITLQGDFTATQYGVFDPSDSEKAYSNMYLQNIGAVKTFSIDDIGSLRGKVIKVKYAEK